MSTSRIAFILGAGPNIGAHLTTAFESRGYKIALASRSADASKNTASKIHVKLDLTQPETVQGAFDEVEKGLGVPSVVIYNASAATFTDKTDPLNPAKVNVQNFASVLAVNTTSAFAAAQAALAGFRKLDASASKTFIYTGNGLNTAKIPMPVIMDGAVGKCGASHLMHVLSYVYGAQGYKFYYADERKEGGGYAIPVNGEAAGEFYPELAESKEQLDWLQTFVKGQGHVKF